MDVPSDLYAPGSSIPLLLKSTSEPVIAHLDRAFEPFTKSQTFVVHFTTTSGSEAVGGLPHEAVLKLFDRRYINDREPQHKDDDDRSWSPERELLVQARWRDIASGATIDDFADVMYTSGPLTGVLHYEPEDDPRLGDVVYEEEGFRRICERRYETELKAYENIKTFQGTHIPICYGAVVVSHPLNNLDLVNPPPVHGIILEYIDGVALDVVDPSTLNYVPHSLLEFVHSMGSHGVIHADIRSGNILATPTRAVLIDFGHGEIRPDDDEEDMGTSDDDAIDPDLPATFWNWGRKVRSEDDVGAIWRILHWRRVRDLTPILPNDYDERDRAIETFNGDMGLYPEDWKKRWYSQMSSTIEDSDQEGVEDEHVVQQWVLKPEVRAWLDTRPPAPDRWRLPRPGSPEFMPTQS